MEVFIYKILNSFEKSFFSLIEKSYICNKRVFVYCPISDRIDYYNKLIWTFKKISFIPHAKLHDQMYEKAPIILSTELSKSLISSFNVLIFIDFYKFYDFIDTDRLIYMVHKNDTISVDKINILSENTFTNKKNISLKIFTENQDYTWNQEV